MPREAKDVGIQIERGQTLSFEEFWRWVVTHPNCVLRAGTEEAFLYDLEEFHWYFTEEPDQTPLVQLIRGKQLVGELLIEAGDILYVQAVPDREAGGEGRFIFELMGGSKEDPVPLYHFLMNHGLEEKENAHFGGLKH
jgi:hypothetical protein